MYGFKNILTGDWWRNDFQNPHFATLNELITTIYAGDTAAFESECGPVANWMKIPAADSDVQGASTAIIAGENPLLYVHLNIDGIHIDTKGLKAITGDAWFSLSGEWGDTTRLPITEEWGMHLYRIEKHGILPLQDTILVSFVDGEATGVNAVNYSYDVDFGVTGKGTWKLYENDFDLVTLDGQTWYRPTILARIPEGLGYRDVIKETQAEGRFLQITVTR